ncbi:unnamed protein product [Acanthoscelides obtectus]|uniref:Nose resistant-to-fluoxetine protein N-terminal domain-containing protein n=1 Tax=Acanthoscelides obtectus TaxID=200917 RepID=A0A9P0KT84_ACAOB|nr:unnamed protein product [Acanthoscelides obtectus]CAK1665169.1 Nose resistant to fluoxetine protein 6 [Acanthoscelides obtectus]
MLLVSLLVVWSCKRTVAEGSADQVLHTYNSSDLSYLSNGIQFPVSDAEVVSLLEHANDNVTQQQWFAGLYDHHKWKVGLDRVDEVDGVGCNRDMRTYLEELRNGTMWAVKMFDASGRYPGQFYFGNDYWLGSKTLCGELTNPATNSEVPPFPVQFYVAKIRININEVATPVTRQLNLGECLPRSCGVNGVKKLLASDRSHGAAVTIVGVRKVPGEYSLLEDFKVHLVGGATLTAIIIVAVSTLVDVVRLKRKKRKIKDAETESNNNCRQGNINVNGSTDIILNSQRKGEQKQQHLSGIPFRILLAFSAIGNSKKILALENVSLDAIKCIHGLRFISIAWIILVHTYLEIFAIADNKSMRLITEREFAYQTIANASFSVDTFFFISGLLVTLTYFRTDSKIVRPKKEETTCQSLQSSTSSFLILLTYRIFRLTPAYLFVLGLNEIIMRYLHSESVFSPAIIDHLSCTSYWWRNILYINNFYPQKEFCMLWSWYIANDTQFYIITSFLLVIAVRGPSHLKFASIACGTLMLTSWITTFVIAMKYDYVIRVEEPFALFDQLYDKPWLRIGPYLVGISMGYLLFKKDCKIAMPPIIAVIGWSLSLACLASLVYGVGRKGLTTPTSAFYGSLEIRGLISYAIVLGCAWPHSLGPVHGVDHSSLQQRLRRHREHFPQFQISATSQSVDLLRLPGPPGFDVPHQFPIRRSFASPYQHGGGDIPRQLGAIVSVCFRHLDNVRGACCQPVEDRVRLTEIVVV